MDRCNINETMTPKVSIIVPCYGVEKYLDRCMESLVNQTLRDIEIILVDDVSPDCVPEMCDEWADRSLRGEKVNGLTIPPIKVVHKEKNEGLGYARNTGLEVATGEYVAFVDSDDYVDTRMYETLYMKANCNELEALFCGFNMQDNTKDFKSVSEVEQYTEMSGEEVKSMVLDIITAPPLSSKEYMYEMSVWHSIYKRSVIETNNLRFISERQFASEDVPFQVDFFRYAKKIAFVPDCFYYYCWNAGSLTKTITKEKFDKIKNLYYLLCEKTKDLDSEGLRAKKLLIGYARANVRTIARSKMSLKDKLALINIVVKDNVWVEVKCKYPLSYIPFKARLLSAAIYSGNSLLTHFLAKIMNAKGR